MIGIYLSLCLPLYQDSVDKPSLKLFQDYFIVRVGSKRAEVPLQLPGEKPRLATSFRKNQNYAVWDERGLTIRIGKVAKSSRLEDVATSPKAFDREQILENSELIEKKVRNRGASALSGAKRVGNLVFFLLRWEDRESKPWMEALVSVDLTADTFHPKFHARLTGLTLADKKIDDRLFVLSDRLSAIVRDGEAWGVASYEPESGLFENKVLGRKLENIQPLTPTTCAFVERTDHGTVAGGVIDLQTQNRKMLTEAKGKMRFADKGTPLLAIYSNNGDSRLLNTETGAELELLGSSAMRRTPLGLVVWSPFRSPKRAWLYDMKRWDVLAQWTSE